MLKILSKDGKIFKLETRYAQDFYVKLEFNFEASLTLPINIPKEDWEWKEVDYSTSAISNSCISKGFLYSDENEYNFSQLFANNIQTKEIYSITWDFGTVFINGTPGNK